MPMTREPLHPFPGWRKTEVRCYPPFRVMIAVRPTSRGCAGIQGRPNSASVARFRSLSRRCHSSSASRTSIPTCSTPRTPPMSSSASPIWTESRRSSSPPPKNLTALHLSEAFVGHANDPRRARHPGHRGCRSGVRTITAATEFSFGLAEHSGHCQVLADLIPRAIVLCLMAPSTPKALFTIDHLISQAGRRRFDPDLPLHPLTPPSSV